MGDTVTSVYTYANALDRKDTEYPMFDGLGSERTVTSSSQTVTGTINHDAFGLTVNTTGSSTNPYKFAANSGYRDDGDAGLSHVGARYYDPQVGRFTTRDTELDQHPYAYCEHDPVNSVDPDGHIPVPVWLRNFIKGFVGNAGDTIADPFAARVGYYTRGMMTYYIIFRMIRHELDLVGNNWHNHANDHDGNKSGHGGIKPGPNDYDHMERGWENEKSQ